MPLRDHFRPPLDDIASWEELHGQWPAMIVQQPAQADSLTAMSPAHTFTRGRRSKSMSRRSRRKLLPRYPCRAKETAVWLPLYGRLHIPA